MTTASFGLNGGAGAGAGDADQATAEGTMTARRVLRMVRDMGESCHGSVPAVRPSKEFSGFIGLNET